MVIRWLADTAYAAYSSTHCAHFDSSLDANEMVNTHDDYRVQYRLQTRLCHLVTKLPLVDPSKRHLSQHAGCACVRQPHHCHT